LLAILPIENYRRNSNMSDPITSVIQVQQAQQTQATDQTTAVNSKTSGSKPQQALADTVTISSAAKAILQEVQENHAQTVQEANGGDSQAKRVLAKEAAAAIAPKG
jgi:hypothetical protein